MKRANFPGNKQDKIKGALARLEARTKLTDMQLVATAKRFKNVQPELHAEIQPDIQKYRADMNAQIEHLKTLVK